MSLKRKVFGAPYNKKIVRRRPVKADLWDKAAEIEDEETEEKMWKLKSNGEKVPKPSEDKIGYLFHYKWWQRPRFLFPRDRIEYAIYNDKGDGDGKWVELSSENVDLSGGGDTRMFDTHRNMQAKKYVDLYSKEDNKEMYILGALGIIVFMDIAATYILTSNADKLGASAVKKAVEAGVKSAMSASEGASGDVPGVSIIPVAGFVARNKISNLFQNLKNQ